jgi:hypothetical protein
MTVDELRTKLADLPADAQVFIYRDGYAPIADVVRTPITDTNGAPVKGFVIYGGASVEGLTFITCGL